MDLPLPGARAFALAFTLALPMGACSAVDTSARLDPSAQAGDGQALAAPSEGQEAVASVPVDPALLGWRSDLASTLSEHALLIAGASAARLDGQVEEHEAYVSLLNEDNAAVLAQVVTAAGDEDDGQALGDWWGLSNDLLLAYAEAVGEGDDAAIASVQGDLDTAAAGLAQTFQDATGVGAGEAQMLIRDHLRRLTDIMDAQAALDDLKAYRLVRDASSGADTVAQPLALAAGGEDPKAPPSRVLASRLRVLLSEHVHLLGQATTAALNGETDHFNAIATAAVEGTAVDLADAVGAAADREAGQAFLSDWNAHIRWVVDYTEATARGDGQAVLDALDGLTDSLVVIADGLEEITGLPSTTSAAAFAGYLTSMSQILDAQARWAPRVDEPEAEGQDPEGETRGSPEQIAAQVLKAARELRALADPLAAAIVSARATFS
jgi:hypothetical protein